MQGCGNRQQVAARQQSTVGEASGRSSSIWSQGVLTSRWATAMGKSGGVFCNLSRHAASGRSLSRSQHPAEAGSSGRRPERIKQGLRHIIKTRLSAQKKKGGGTLPEVSLQPSEGKKACVEKVLPWSILTRDPWAQARLLSTAVRAGLRLCSPHDEDAGERS